MSTHEVKVIRIENIRPHSNADSLEITDIWGYQCVIRKGVHQVGDLLAFIEPDYKVKLTRPEFAFLDTGKGKEWERITMRKFRGERSYGLLVPAPAGSQEGDNVMELLEVERYEPPTHGHGFGPTGFLSGMCDTGPEVPAPTYDLENHKKFHKYFTLNEEIILSEKIHGSNARYCFHNEKMHCGSRTTWKKPPGQFIKHVTYKDQETGDEVEKDVFTPESAWWHALAQNPWIEDWCRAHPGMVLYGEVYGPHVQGQQFKYGKADGQYGFAVFDVLDHGQWVDNSELFDNPTYSDGMVETVKVLYRGGYDPVMIERMAEEPSVYPNQKIREGLVIKPVKERSEHGVGRMALKHVADQYLMAK